MHHKATMCPQDGLHYCIFIPGHQGAQIKDFNTATDAICCLFTTWHHGAPGHDSQAVTLTNLLRFTERDDVVVAGVGPPGPRGIQHGAVFQENGGVIITHGIAQQADSIFCIGWHGHLPTDGMDPLYLVTLAVPGVAYLEKTTGYTNNHWRRKTVGGAPAHGAAVIELFFG